MKISKNILAAYPAPNILKRPRFYKLGLFINNFIINHWLKDCSEYETWLESHKPVKPFELSEAELQSVTRQMEETH